MAATSSAFTYTGSWGREKASPSADVRVRGAEWLLLIYFAFLAGIAPFFPARPYLGLQPLLLTIVVSAVVFAVAWMEPRTPGRTVSWFRDWFPIALLFAAFRELDCFAPGHYTMRFEATWLTWDHALLHDAHLQNLIEATGWFLPGVFELSYLLVYGVGAFSVAALWLSGRRERVNNFYLVYLSGALLAYALIPWFPSLPPRFVAPLADLPHIVTPMRQLNLWILNQGTIRSGVFPSAHVSSAFAAAFGLLLVLPEWRRFGWFAFWFAVIVSIATVYGRYHYAADAVAGLFVSLLALGGIAALKHMDYSLLVVPIVRDVSRLDSLPSRK
jgi:membrane-associated phospholipid phosphatase